MTEHSVTNGPKPSSFSSLMIGSIGVVYGDIGTSPLYALKQSLTSASEGTQLNNDMVLGVVSLTLWTLMIVVTLKYVLLIMRADNHGEGGTLTLMALLQSALGRRFSFIIWLGMIGAALFYGDAVITPAISVLSAVEGVKLVAPQLAEAVLPSSALIIVLLFLFQSRGTGFVAAWFGPIMIVWFVVIALGGLWNLFSDTGIIGALNPVHGISFLLNHGHAGLLALGAVFLTVTGAEALYADMGHFGREPIRAAWLYFIFPSLALNYLGQGAMLMADPAKLENPFFLLFPSWALLPMVALATVATIIASQAVISGAYSLSQQAMQLGLIPRMEVRKTSETERGQIYVPRVNWLLLVAVLYLVFSFRSSDALASAYGVAVTGTMVITSVMAFFVMWKCWNWSLSWALLVITPFILTDAIFLSANLLKIFEGGWIPLAIGAALLTLMATWRQGSTLLFERTAQDKVDLLTLARSVVSSSNIQKVSGTAVFLTGHPDLAPTSLLHNLKHNKVLHEKNLIAYVVTADVPRVSPEDRMTVEALAPRFERVTLRFGYMERPNVPKALAAGAPLGIKFDIMTTSFFLSRRVLRTSGRPGMQIWQKRLFTWLARLADDTTAYFGIPSGRAIEVGAQVSL